MRPRTLPAGPLRRLARISRSHSPWSSHNQTCGLPRPRQAAKAQRTRLCALAAWRGILKFQPTQQLLWGACCARLSAIGPIGCVQAARLTTH